METERIALSQREWDRLKVLHEVQQKQLTNPECSGMFCRRESGMFTVNSRRTGGIRRSFRWKL